MARGNGVVADGLSDRAADLNAAGAHGQAEAACRRALALVDRHWAALANLAVSLHRQGRHWEAVPAYLDALRACPTNVDACTNLGVALNEMGAMEASLQAHDAAASLAPRDAQVIANRAMALLMAGRLEEGFAAFEARWELPQPGIPDGLSAVRWQGEALGGRLLFVWDEGGFGDTLQFIRYVRLLLAQGARVALRVQAPLLRLVAQSLPGLEALVSHANPTPAHDLHCPMISLAQAFATSLATVPGETPYLAVDRLQALHWRRVLAPLPGPRVGIVWRGAARPGMVEAQAMDARRSLPLAQLAPILAVPGIDFISLQLGGEAEIAACGETRLLNPMRGMRDFADTASLVAGLDLVISVDSAVAHLAGGLGRPVWVISRFDACWRWLAGRADTPWYPGMRVYRPDAPMAWDKLVERIAEDLAAWRRAWGGSTTRFGAIRMT